MGLCDAMMPRTYLSSSINISGDAVVLDSGRKTRSGSEMFLREIGSVDEKICVYESFDRKSASEVALLAKKAGAKAFAPARC